MTTIPFQNIPANWSLPLWWGEVDSSRAGTATSRQPALLVGIRTTGSGIATSNAIVGVSSGDTADALWGKGSMIASMVRAFLAGNSTQVLYGCGVAEPAAGVKASGTITVASAPTAAGTLNLYIAGQRVQVAIAATDTANGVATKINAAIAAALDLPVTSTVATNVVTVTCRWKGATGNDITMRDSVLGLDGGEVLPTGLALTYAAMSGGTASPDLAGAILAMGDDDYKFCATPFMDLIATEYGFGDTGRWGFIRQLYGAVYTAVRETYANLLSAGPTRNDPVISRMAIEPGCPSPVWDVAAAYCAKAAKGFTNDPARPLQTLALDGMTVAPRGERFSTVQCNSLAGVGLATQYINADGKMAIRRETSSYQKNTLNVADDAYTDMTTLYTLSTLFERQRQAITSKFPRHKLADDGTRFGPGAAIVTPKIIKGELIAQYALDEYEGLVENARAFAQNLIVVRSQTNPNRLDVLYPPDLINQLRVFAVLGQFRLQYDRTPAAA